MRQTVSVILGLVLVAILTPSAYGWNKAGHMASGAMAYELLKKQDPQALAKVVALLKQHPHFESMWRRRLDRASAENRDCLLLMLAARWPDDIRDDPDFDRPKWHYIDFGFKPAGQPDSVKITPPDDTNAFVGFRTNVEVLQTDKPAGEQGIAICWILHLVGDIHQPLHATSLFTTEFAEAGGDQGGTKGFVRLEKEAEPITLHRLWDDLIITDDEFGAVKTRAAELLNPRADMHRFKKKVSFSDFEAWTQESFETAKRDVYHEGKFHGTANKEQAAVVPDAYRRHATAVAERRFVLGAHRLAAILSAVVDKDKPSPPDCKKSP